MTRHEVFPESGVGKVMYPRTNWSECPDPRFAPKHCAKSGAGCFLRRRLSRCAGATGCFSFFKEVSNGCKLVKYQSQAVLASAQRGSTRRLIEIILPPGCGCRLHA